MSTLSHDLRPGVIDVEGLPARLAATAIAPGTAGYDQSRHTYSAAGAPGLVIVPESAGDVADAVGFAAAQAVPLSVRSGGHGPSTNDDGIVIDLGRLRGVEVLDASRRLVRVEGGARWGEVAAALGRHRLALTSGDWGDVGVGGIASTGGIGLLARQQGLTIDRVRAVELVLADGTAVRADDGHHADLLWAVRGAGGSFGVATAFELEAGAIGDVISATFVYRATDLAGLLERWAALVERSPREVTSFLYVYGQGGGSAPPAKATVVHASDDLTAAGRALAPFSELAPTLDRRVELLPYADLLAAPRAPHSAQAAGFAARAGLLDHVGAETAAPLAELMTAGAADVLQLRSVGGAVNDLAAGATAYAHRRQRFSLVVATLGRRGPLDAIWGESIVRQARGTYLNLEADRDDAVVRRAYPAPTLARLQRLKRRYDPTGVFDHSLAIPATRAAA